MFVDPQSRRDKSDLYMLVVKVLLGRVYAHDEAGGTELPCYKKGCFTAGCKRHQLCDSIVAGLDKKFKEFIIYNADMCLPIFVVKYDRQW